MFKQEQGPIVSNTVGNVINELEKDRLEREREQKRKDFKSRVAALTEKAAQMYKDRGPDDNISILLTSFLDVAIEMETLMDTLTSINVAMECMNDAIGFLDAAIDFDNALMDQSLEHSYNWFQRWMLRRKMKKTIKNNCGRMMAIAKGLEMKYTMAQDMLKALSGVGDKLKKTMEKNNKKKANEGNAPTGPSAAQKAIGEYMASKGETVATTTTTTTNEPKGSSSSGDGNIDDIA